MHSIFKYELRTVDRQIIEVPKGAILLSLQTQFNLPCLWMHVDPDAPKEMREILIHGTGHLVKSYSEMIYIGTFQLDGGALVFHVFENLVRKNK